MERQVSVIVSNCPDARCHAGLLHCIRPGQSLPLTVEDFAELGSLLNACICIRSAAQQLSSLLELLELWVLVVGVSCTSLLLLAVVAAAGRGCNLAVLLLLWMVLQLTLLLAGHL